MKIRVIKTSSHASAVQVVRYQNNKRIVLHHFGSAHTEEALNDLKVMAQEWIKDYTNQLSIFPNENPNRLLHINHSTFIGVKYHFFYSQILAILEMIKLDNLPSLLTHFAAIRS